MPAPERADTGGANLRHDPWGARRTERVHWQPHPLDWDRVYRWEIRPSGTVAADHICTTGTRAYLAQSRKGL